MVSCQPYRWGRSRCFARWRLIYRKDKALSKAALAFIQVILEHAGNESSAEKPSKLPEAASIRAGG